MKVACKLESLVFFFTVKVKSLKWFCYSDLATLGMIYTCGYSAGHLQSFEAIEKPFWFHKEPLIKKVVQLIKNKKEGIL